MNKNSVAEALRALAESENRSEMAKLREVFDEVEAVLSAGVNRMTILETLHEQGFTMTAKSFESALYRLRKQHKVGKLHKKKIAPLQVAVSSAAETMIAAPQGLTPKRKDEAESADLANLTPKERREKRADQFIKPESTNPLLPTYALSK